MIDPVLVSLVSAVTALVASITGPVVTLHIGRAQIRATVLSTNRQKWIDGFRDAIASFCSQVAVAVQVRDQIVRDGRLDLSDKQAILDEFEKLVFTFTKIRLMINPAEDHRTQLLAVMHKLLADFRTAPASIDFSAEAEKTVDVIVAMSQAMVREECSG